MREDRNRFTGALLLLFFCTFTVPGSLWAETAEEAVENPVSESKRPLKRKKDIVPIQPGDKIRVKIFPEDEYIKGGEMEVSSEGNITLPLVGKVSVAGKTPVQAEQVIAKIIDADYIVNPEVSIEMAGRSESAKLTVIVLGQVHKPGPYEFPPDKKSMTLLEAISLAGGFSEIANIKKIKIVRTRNGQKHVIHANAEAIMSGGETDVELEPGDVVNVSESLF